MVSTTGLSGVVTDVQNQLSYDGCAQYSGLGLQQLHMRKQERVDLWDLHAVQDGPRSD